MRTFPQIASGKIRIAFSSSLAENNAVPNVSEDLFRQRLRTALSKANIAPTTLSHRIGRGKDYLRDYLDGRKKSMAASDAAAIEAELGLSPGALRNEISALASGTHKPAPDLLGERDLPVYAAVEGGPGEMVVSTDPIENVPRPWFLKGKEGYAVLVVGDSMEPEFEPGDYAIVNPHLPAVRGKTAIFIRQEHEGDFRASLKRLLRTTETHWIVKQFNPPKELKLPKTEWRKALRVVGKYAGG